MKAEIKNRIKKINSGEVPEGYKKSKSGIIPRDWGVQKFEDITEILRCGIASTPQYVEDGVAFLSSQNVKENKIIFEKYKYISREYHEKLSRNNQVVKGDILYTRVGANFGLAAIVDTDMEFSIYVSLTHIRMRQGYDNSFYSYMLNSDYYKNLAQKSVFQGGGVPNLNVKIVEKFDMLTPNIQEQQKMAEILSTWDKAIELNEQLIEKKKQQKKGLMKKLLTGEVRLPEFVGEIVKKKLKEYIKESKERNRKGAETVVLSVTNKQGFILQEDQFDRVVASKDLSNYKIVRKNQFAYNPSRINVGSIDLLKDFEVGLLSPMYVVFECTDEIGIEYLYQFLKSEMFTNLIPNLLQGSVRDSLSFDSLQIIELFVPQLKEQKAIANILQTADFEIELFEQKLSSLKLQKKGLMQLLLPGIVRVQC